MREELLSFKSAVNKFKHALLKIFTYSYFNAFTGFAYAAFKAW